MGRSRLLKEPLRLGSFHKESCWWLVRNQEGTSRALRHFPPVKEVLNLAEHNPKNNRMRAK
jgi:hypothetical protein